MTRGESSKSGGNTSHKGTSHRGDKPKHRVKGVYTEEGKKDHADKERWRKTVQRAERELSEGAKAIFDKAEGEEVKVPLEQAVVGKTAAEQAEYDAFWYMPDTQVRLANDEERKTRHRETDRVNGRRTRIRGRIRDRGKLQPDALALFLREKPFGSREPGMAEARRELDRFWQSEEFKEERTLFPYFKILFEKYHAAGGEEGVGGAPDHPAEPEPAPRSPTPDLTDWGLVAASQGLKPGAIDWIQGKTEVSDEDKDAAEKWLQKMLGRDPPPPPNPKPAEQHHHHHHHARPHTHHDKGKQNASSEDKDATTKSKSKKSKGKDKAVGPVDRGDGPTLRPPPGAPFSPPEKEARGMIYRRGAWQFFWLSAATQSFFWVSREKSWEERMRGAGMVADDEAPAGYVDTSEGRVPFFAAAGKNGRFEFYIKDGKGKAKTIKLEVAAQGW